MSELQDWKNLREAYSHLISRPSSTESKSVRFDMTQQFSIQEFRNLRKEKTIELEQHKIRAAKKPMSPAIQNIVRLQIFNKPIVGIFLLDDHESLEISQSGPFGEVQGKFQKEDEFEEIKVEINQDDSLQSFEMSLSSTNPMESLSVSGKIKFGSEKLKEMSLELSSSNSWTTHFKKGLFWYLISPIIQKIKREEELKELIQKKQDIDLSQGEIYQENFQEISIDDKVVMRSEKSKENSEIIQPQQRDQQVFFQFSNYILGKEQGKTVKSADQRELSIESVEVVPIAKSELVSFRQQSYQGPQFISRGCQIKVQEIYQKVQKQFPFFDQKETEVLDRSDFPDGMSENPLFQVPLVQQSLVQTPQFQYSLEKEEFTQKQKQQSQNPFNIQESQVDQQFQFKIENKKIFEQENILQENIIQEKQRFLLEFQSSSAFKPTMRYEQPNQDLNMAVQNKEQFVFTFQSPTHQESPTHKSVKSYQQYLEQLSLFSDRSIKSQFKTQTKPEKVSISIEQIPDSSAPLVYTQQSLIHLYSAIEKFSLNHIASHICLFFYELKRKWRLKREKQQKFQLGVANHEFNLLRKSTKILSEYRDKSIKFKKVIFHSLQEHREKWDFIHSFRVFSAFKYICKAHKNWIQQVQNQFLERRKKTIFQDWNLYVQYRKIRIYLKLKKVLFMVQRWKKYIKDKKEREVKSLLFWYRKLMFKSVKAWKIHKQVFFVMKEKNCRAQSLYREKIKTKTFKSWTRLKQCIQYSYVPIKISTTRTLTRENGRIHEKSSYDIRVINRQ